MWRIFLNAAITGALQGGAASSQAGGSLKDTGITAGVGALAALLQAIVTHPVTTKPATTAVLATKVS